MARGALDHSHAQVAVAVSGIAGPSGGTADKPVGTVCLAWARRDGTVWSETRSLSRATAMPCDVGRVARVRWNVARHRSVAAEVA